MSRFRLVESWSRAEWERLPIAARPEGAIRFGDGWVLLTEDASMTPPRPMVAPPERSGDWRGEANRWEEASGA